MSDPSTSAPTISVPELSTLNLSSPINSSPLGVFDSGVGGLSVLREIHRLLPHENLIFLGDQAHVPYGPRPLQQVRDFSETITRFLLDQGAKLIVVACNTASAAALYGLRETFPTVPFVGMEPAIKPAAEQTQSGVVGVLATPATFQGQLYASVVERFANGVVVLQDTCPGLVRQIENGELDSTATREILERALTPMLENGIDRVVMGCTHYPFVIPLIEEIVGPRVQVIDPAPAVARQVGRVLKERGLANTAYALGQVRFLTSDDPAELSNLLRSLLGEQSPVDAVIWQDGDLSVKPQMNANER